MPMDPVLSAAVRRLGGEIAQLHGRLAQLEQGSRTAGLKYSSVDGGGLLVNDDTGTTRQVIGAQADGTVTTVDLNAAPPSSPAAPALAAVAAGLVVGWDGLLGGAGPLSDFLWTEVHVSTSPGFSPSPLTLTRTMQAGGTITVAGLTPGVTYYAVLVGVNRSRVSSAPSPQSSAVPLTTTQTIPAGSITPGLLSFTAGGMTVSVGPAAPSSPAVNDLWFDTAHDGRLNQWTGSAWTLYTFGTQAITAGSITAALIAAGTITAAQIAAGTITAAQIAAGTITATLLQAGIVVANIVNGTVVTGATLQNSATNPRTAVNPDGSITITNAPGTVIFRIGPDGTIYWYSTAGALLMTLAPGGTQLIYASLTGPFVQDFEPPSAPAPLLAFQSVVSAASYTSAALPVPVVAGAVVTVIASANGTTAATGVTDTKGNAYSLVQSQTGAAPYQQVFQAQVPDPAHALTTTDTLTVTYAAANAQAKNIVAVATSGVPAVSPVDLSAAASGTSTAPAVTASPAGYGEAVLFCLTAAGAAAPSAVADGWSLVAGITAAGTQWTGLYQSATVAAGSLTASATLAASGSWQAVMIALKDATPQTAPVPSNATASASTSWADDGNFSCKLTKVGAATSWGITFAPFPVQGGGAYHFRVAVSTAGPIALPALSTGMTFWSGPNGTGSNLGRWSVSWGTQAQNLLVPYTVVNCMAPSNAVSATVDVTEGQADTAGNWFAVDNLSVPGGLAYSNSPVATADGQGNPVPQGINFVGLPSLANVLGVQDPYVGRQLAAIDGSGNVTGQTVSAATDLQVGGQSVPNDLIPPLAQGMVNYGFVSLAGNWPSTPIGTTETSLFELDQAVVGGRIYEFSVNPSIVLGTGGTYPTVIHLQLRYTADGSTPTTSSPLVTQVPAVLAAGSQSTPWAGLRCQFFPAGSGTYRFLVTGYVNSGTWQFASGDPFLRCAVYDLGTYPGQGNSSATILGTGSGGGASKQTYTEYFYGNATWTYWEYGLRGSNTTIYQGGYSGEGYAQYCFIQFSVGSLGNNLNTVLSYPAVNKVSFRLLCQHTWYNSGATVSLHSSTQPGTNLGAISSELGSWHVTPGVFNVGVLPSSAWAPFKAGGLTYAVLRPPGGSLDLSYYSYFWGGGTNNANVPAFIVNYTH